MKDSKFPNIKVSLAPPMNTWQKFWYGGNSTYEIAREMRYRIMNGFTVYEELRIQRAIELELEKIQNDREQKLKK